MLRLDGADVTGEKQAAELLGMKGSTFPAKKAMGQARKLGHDRTVRIVDLLAQADLDLRGGKAWPDGLVLEALVARIPTMSRCADLPAGWRTPDPNEPGAAPGTSKALHLKRPPEALAAA